GPLRFFRTGLDRRGRRRELLLTGLGRSGVVKASSRTASELALLARSDSFWWKGLLLSLLADLLDQLPGPPGLLAVMDRPGKFLDSPLEPAVFATVVLGVDSEDHQLLAMQLAEQLEKREGAAAAATTTIEKEALKSLRASEKDAWAQLEKS